MKYQTEYFFCSPKLLQNVDELKEIYDSISKTEWEEEFEITVNGRQYKNQSGYNKAFEIELKHYGWGTQPFLHEGLGLKGDFRKNDVLVEVQFGNSATLYRDYYKFHYGLTHNLLALAVLIVPTKPKIFFPTRPKSVSNMAEFDLALRYFKVLQIPVPILLIGLLPQN
jgi:hypothetical protein